VTLGLAARSTDELQELAAALPGDHHVLRCDVADEASVREAVGAFTAAAGGLDLVIANAGLTHYGPFRDQTMAQLRQMTDVNWYGTLFTVHAALPVLLEQGSGHVVIVSSGAGLRSFPGAAVYGATKAAQRMFGEALRHELGGTGVGLTVVYPGEIATTLHDHEKDRMPAWYRGGADAAPPQALAAKVLAAIEKDARAVYHPPLVRVLGALHGLSPQLSDRLLRRLRGTSAAPRVD
jgi:NADP-dependent 3-hydroxy acid dehydrogenase YdfG